MLSPAYNRCYRCNKPQSEPAQVRCEPNCRYTLYPAPEVLMLGQELAAWFATEERGRGKLWAILTDPKYTDWRAWHKLPRLVEEVIWHFNGGARMPLDPYTVSDAVLGALGADESGWVDIESIMFGAHDDILICL